MYSIKTIIKNAMKYKILLPLLVSVALLNACSKDKAETELPGDTILETYYPGNAMEIKELALYTTNEVITDGAIIKDFMDRNLGDDVKKHFYPGLTTVPLPVSSTLLHFLNDNRVNVNGVNMQIVGYKDSLMVVSEYTSVPMPNANFTCNVLANKVMEYNAYTDCSTCSSYRKTSPIIANGSNYYAPLLTYAVKTDGCFNVPKEIPAINIRNHNLQSEMVEGDTVLLQYAKLPLVKRAKED
jgi:hypothetical protein